MAVRHRRYLAGAIIATAALAAVATTATVAQAVPAPATHREATVSAGDIVFEPGARGYTGSLTMSLTYQGTTSDNWMEFAATEPVPGSFIGVQGSEACGETLDAVGRRVITCGVSLLQPGDKRSITMQFQVLTTPRAFAMKVADGSVYASRYGQRLSNMESFTTRFRSTTGSLRNPQTYVPDTKSNISVTSAATAMTLVPQEDGSFIGRIPVNVRWNGDAAHYGLDIGAALPGGWFVWGTEPSANLPCPDSCPIPNATGGWQFMQGEASSFDLLIRAPAGTAAGSYPLTATVQAQTNDGPLTDVSPADNGFAFTATI